MRMTTKLRELLGSGRVVLAPGVYDVLSAKIAERAGFEALELGGNAITCSLLGMPDLGAITMTEMLQVTRNIVAAVQIPVIVDVDTGYGNALNLVRALRECERAGAAGVHIEDQIMPPNMQGRPVVSAEEMVGKIRAAVAARTDPDFVIVARCDALPSLGLEEAIRRGQAYREAGADVTFITLPSSVEEMRAITGAIAGPHMLAVSEGGRVPPLTAQELQGLGYSIVTHATFLLRASARALQRVAGTLHSTGSIEPLIPDLMPTAELSGLLDMDQHRTMERRFVVR